MKQIILASSSPRRKMLLEQIGLSCKVVPSNYEEHFNPRLKPKGQAEFLAREKAKAVAEKYRNQDVIIIAADQVIDFKGESLGKPRSSEEAERMLRRLSGERHTAITSYTILDMKTSRTVTRSVETNVYFKKLTPKEINSYVITGEPLGRAGSYAIDHLGAVLVERIDGDYYNILGLPIAQLADDLKRFGLPIM
jgi:septum formation protein